MTCFSKKLTIIVDMDEVLADTLSQWLKLYNSDYNDFLTKEDIKGWNVHLWVKPECARKVYDYLDMENFFLEMDPIPGAIDGMKYLVDSGHDVIIATATPRHSHLANEEKKNWIRKYLPFFDLKNFSDIHRKDLIVGDLLFDDGIHNLSTFQGISVCMDRPWNRGEELCDVRVQSWSQFVTYVNDITKDELHFDCTIEKVGERLEKREW